jgi:iron(III) transport system substrate-binding protein
VRTRLFFRYWVAIAALATALVAAGGAASAPSATTTRDAAPAAAPTAAAPKPYTTQEWNALIARAKREGEVTLYSSHLPANLQRVADAFKAKYGITVTFNRQIDSVLASQVTTAMGGNNGKVDIWMQSSRPILLGAIRNKWVVDARGPAFFAKEYNRANYAKPGKAWAVGAAVLGLGWNSTLTSRRITDYPDLLASGVLRGKIGVPEPALPSFVDFYLWLEETYGANFVRRLGATRPRIYASTLPMQQAMTSGEIAAAVLTPATTIDLKAQGAPVDFAIPKKAGAWNAPWHGMILTGAPHPAAAQLLSNFLVTREGQQLLNRRYGAVLRGVPETFFVTMRVQKLSELTPAKIAAFQQSWNRMFRG